MSNFEINNKYLSTTGIIGRRDFIVNYLITTCICSVIFVTPVIYFLLFNPEHLADFSQVGQPKWFSIIYMVMGIVSAGLLLPSIIRRIRDILAIEDDEKIKLLSATTAVIFLIGHTPILNNSFGNFLTTLLLFLLILMQGKITSQKPKSKIIKFNWGAFLGTWIWGSFNKIPVTFLMLPLLLTCGGLYFMLICGLKGNEWTYEKNKDKITNLDNFHKNQSNQSLILLLLAPIIFIVSSTFLLGGSSYILYKKVKTSPEIKTKIENFLLKQQAYSVEAFYSKIEIKDGTATFYLSPDIWKDANSQIKQSIYKNAISYALQKQGKKGLMLTDFIANIELVNNVKIISSFNNEPLAQFYIEPTTLKQKTQGLDLNEIQEFWNSGYKFNNSPSLP